MTISYADSAALMTDAAFHGRTKIACLHFADYIRGEADTVPAHATRLRWAEQTFVTPDNSVAQIMSTLVMDPAVQADGAAITDPALQSSVEASVNKLI